MHSSATSFGRAAILDGFALGMKAMARPDAAELKCADGETIAYLRRDGKAPTIVWFGGFKSDMTGTKAEALDCWAANAGHAFLRFDYFGHGRSSGDFRGGTITRWRNDALAIVDRLTTGPLVVVGSSMGAWLGLLAAQQRPQRIRALLLLAPAVDFTETLLWARLSPEIRDELAATGEWLRASAYDPEPYPITRTLIEDGRNHLLLNATIRLDCPVRILQGMRDPDVPWTHAISLVERLSGDAVLSLVKDGDHRLSRPQDLRRLTHSVEELIGAASM